MNIGITGSIACGKTTVSDYLKKSGYTVIDADKITHDILEDSDTIKELISVFGDSIVTMDAIDRKKLGSIVFGNDSNLKKLNSILHPKIKNIIKEKQKKHSAENIVFVDVALLFEAKFTDLVDKVIVVYVDESTQIERLKKRNNLSEQEALKRIKSQLGAEEKAKLGDYVIDNSKSVENTYAQIENIIKELKKEENN